jgi:hypothetical protein
MGERIRHHSIIGVAGKNGYKKKNCNSWYGEAIVGLTWTEMRELLSLVDDQKSIAKVKITMDTNDGRRLESWSNTAVRRLADFERDGRAAPPVFFRTVPVALTGAARLQADRISSCCNIVNVHNHPL